MYTESHEDYYNSTMNTANKVFNTEIAGTSNMTSILGAHALMAKGHYFGLSVNDSLPNIVGSDGKAIEGKFEDDESYIGVESMTGTTVITKQRYFLNLVVQQDELFDLEEEPEHGNFMPLVFTKRENSWDEDQAMNSFKELIEIQRAKWAIFGSVMGLGLFLIIISFLLICRLRRLKNELSQFEQSNQGEFQAALLQGQGDRDGDDESDFAKAGTRIHPVADGDKADEEKKGPELL